MAQRIGEVGIKEQYFWYAAMYVVTAGGSHQIASLEKKLINHFWDESFLRNKVGGGGHVSRAADTVWYLYVVTA